VKKCKPYGIPKLKVKLFNNSGHVIKVLDGKCAMCDSIDIGETTEESVDYWGGGGDCPQYKVWIEK
jgi:hypothetical protein